MKGVALVLLIVASVTVTRAQFKNCGNTPSGVFTPNRANCDYFFLCVDGYMMQLKCAPYAVFDPIDQICTENCDLPPVTTPSTTTTTSGGIPTAPTIGPPDTEDPCYELPNGSYVAIPGSCSYFWYCRNGKGLMSQCPQGTCFNDDHKLCM